MSRNIPALFVADWMDVAFIHFRVDPALLEPSIPFELDLLDGRAYVSLVAFTQRRLRPTFGGRLTELLAAPLAEHEFLNLRTYVKHDGNAGIYFLAEWIPNRLAQFIGPRLYGLPYRLGRLEYRSRCRSVRSYGHALLFDIEPRSARYAPDARDDFLVERYSAYTSRGGVVRRFEIAHDRWELTDVDVVLRQSDLLGQITPYLVNAKPACAHYSPGVRDVQISMPRVLTSPAARARRSQYRLHRSGNAGCP